MALDSPLITLDNSAYFYLIFTQQSMYIRLIITLSADVTMWWGTRLVSDHGWGLYSWAAIIHLTHNRRDA